MKRLWYALRMFVAAWRVYGDLHKLAAKTAADKREAT
jgi:hypothetical protein